MLSGHGRGLSWDERLEAFQANLNYRFKDRRLLIQALTHRSWLKESQDRGSNLEAQDQQRLEFLGDAFLGYAVGHCLFEQNPRADEGVLTEGRKRLVEGRWLTQVGEELQVTSLVLLGRGEEAVRWRNERLCKDTVEALIGAVLLDGGEHPARALIERLMVRTDTTPTPDQDPIIAFGEFFQRVYRSNPPEPDYARAGGTDHSPLWRASIELGNGTRAEAIGAGKKEAKREACRRALEVLSGLD